MKVRKLQKKRERKLARIKNLTQEIDLAKKAVVLLEKELTTLGEAVHNPLKHP